MEESTDQIDFRAQSHSHSLPVDHCYQHHHHHHHHHHSYRNRSPSLVFVVLSLVLYSLLVSISAARPASSPPSPPPSPSPSPSKPPPFPVIAHEYATIVSAWFPLSSYSLSYSEAYSASQGIYKRDGHYQMPSMHEYISRSNNTLTALYDTTSTCVTFTLNASQISSLWYAPSADLFDMISLLPFDWIYSGQTEVRETMTNHWQINNLTIDTNRDVLCRVVSAANTTCINSTTLYQRISTQQSWFSWSQLLDQTYSLTNSHRANYSFTLDFYVNTATYTTLTGNIPVRIKLSGTQTITNNTITTSTPFLHTYDYMQFRPLARTDFSMNTSVQCIPSRSSYTPPVPLSLNGTGINFTINQTLPALATSFTMYVEFYTQSPDPPEGKQTNASAVTWIADSRLQNELTVYVTVDRNRSTHDHWRYYNYSAIGGGVVWTVSGGQCTLDRVEGDNSNLLSSGRPGSLTSVFYDYSHFNPESGQPLPPFLSSSPFNASSYSYHGRHTVNGIPVLRYSASFKNLLAGFEQYTYTSHIYFLLPTWQYLPAAAAGPYLYPFSVHNEGVERDVHPVDDDHGGKDHDPHDGDHDGEPSKQEPFTDSWTISGYFPQAPPSAVFDLTPFNCGTGPDVPDIPDFPPAPAAYTATIVVSTSITGQTYGFTEYVMMNPMDNSVTMYRADGRYTSDNIVQVMDQRQGTLTFYASANNDGAPFGYGSRVDGLGSNMLSRPLTGSACNVTNSMSTPPLPLPAQLLNATYPYYLNVYDFSQWTHEAPTTLYGSPVDLWTALVESSTNDTQRSYSIIHLNTANYYFSPSADATNNTLPSQVPLRFEFSRILMYVNDTYKDEYVLESTFVDFVQFTPMDGLITAYPDLFDTPPVSTCVQQPKSQVLTDVVTALAHPAVPLTYTALPVIPDSFTALLIVPLLAPASSTLYAVRWYRDGTTTRERVDFAPLSTVDWRSASSSMIYNYEYDVGSYQILSNNTCVTNNNWTALQTAAARSQDPHGAANILAAEQAKNYPVNPLYTHMTGTLPDFFDSSQTFAFTVSESDYFNGIAVMCFSASYSLVHNPYTQYNCSYTRRACFAQSKWIMLGRAGPAESLVSIQDQGTMYYYAATTGGGMQQQDFEISYAFSMFEATQPADGLFNLTQHGCVGTGINEIPSGDSGTDSSANSSWKMIVAIVIPLVCMLFFLVFLCRYYVYHASDEVAESVSTPSLFPGSPVRLGARLNGYSCVHAASASSLSPSLCVDAGADYRDLSSVRIVDSPSHAYVEHSCIVSNNKANHCRSISPGSFNANSISMAANGVHHHVELAKTTVVKE